METFNRAADAMRAAAQDFMNSGSTAVVCMVLPDRCGACCVQNAGRAGLPWQRWTCCESVQVVLARRRQL